MTGDPNAPVKFRYEITFAKEGALRFCGQLDLQRTFERAIRRAKLPLAYSQGFHPHPKLNLGAALPLGIISRCEVADVWLEQPVPPADILQALQAASPEGLRILAAQPADTHTPALQTRIASAEYQIHWHPEDKPLDLEGRVETLLAQAEIIRQRRKKTYNLRPLIEEMEVHPGSESEPQLFLRVCLQPGKTGRPDEVLRAMGLDPYQPDIIRTAFHLKPDPAEETD